MNVLVTGATSLIGQRTVEQLVARGDTVTTFQRHASGLPARDVLGSIHDVAAVAAACSGQHAVVHLAARVGAAGSWDDFESVNVAGTGALLGEARRAGVSAFVHVSSPAVAHHGRAIAGAPAMPADPAAVSGHYARSKALAERLALDASDTAMPVVVIRPHLVWGPGDTQLVGRVVERARRGSMVLVGSGAALVDTTYVDNAASSLVAALDRAQHVHGRPFVVSNGEPRMIHELVIRILAAARCEAVVRRLPVAVAVAAGSVVERIWERTNRRGDPPMTRFAAEQLATAHWFDQRETRRALQWAPQVTIDEGLARLTGWFASRTRQVRTTVGRRAFRDRRRRRRGRAVGPWRSGPRGPSRDPGSWRRFLRGPRTIRPVSTS